MSDVKERIIGAVTIMNEKDAARFWEIIQASFNGQEWNSIPEEAPDSMDLEMLEKIGSNPNCHEFVSCDEAMKELGI